MKFIWQTLQSLEKLGWIVNGKYKVQQENNMPYYWYFINDQEHIEIRVVNITRIELDFIAETAQIKYV